MNSYCSKCDKISEPDTKTIDETFNVKGDNIAIKSRVALCNACGEKIFNQELDEKNLNLAYSIYRKNHNLLSPTEIANIRKKYLLSQRSLASLLEWGEVTIHRYESGAIQDPVHNEVLIFISDPRNMKELFERNNQFLTYSARKRIEKVIDDLISEKLKPEFATFLEDYMLQKQRMDEYSGFTRFDFDKMLNMILYIAEKAKGVFTTKLNKLLWYADFLNFKTYAKSITGSNYLHLPLGPVPENYEWFIAVAADEDLLTREEVIFPNGSAGIEHNALTQADLKYFNKDEVKIIDFVIDFFKNDNCADIKEKSHKEEGYKKTCNREKISYKYATDLSISLSL